MLLNLTTSPPFAYIGKNMIEFINENTGLISLLFSATVAISTVVYAFLTWKLVSETRKVRKVQTEPELSVYIMPNEESIQFVDIFFENIGMAPAYNAKFKVISGDDVFNKPKLSEVGLFIKGLRYFAPKQKIKLFLGSFPQYLQNNNKVPIEVLATYENVAGEIRYSHFFLDLEEYLNITRLGEPSLKTIANSIKKLQEDFHWILTGSRKLKVDTFDKEDREEAERIIEERYNEMKDKQKQDVTEQK